MESLKMLVRLWWRPAQAMSAILDNGSLLFASLCLIALTAPLVPALAPRTGFSIRFYDPLLVLAVFYVPGILLLISAFGGLGASFGAAFHRDYSSLLTCTAMAATAAGLPLLLAAWTSTLVVFRIVAALAAGYFLFLMFFAIRTVFGAENRTALGVVALSWLPLGAAVLLWGTLRGILGMLASPFFLFYAYYYLAGEVGNLGAGLRSRQNFRRMLDAATVNPHDGEAQYQLGVIYQQRRQYTEALDRFRRAVAIDPRETDAHFQLGRIAREQGRLKDALGHFQAVIDLDPKHSQNEILRELGALYVTARQFEDARAELEPYVERRPYDPEGLYHFGLALDGLGRQGEARTMYERAIEAARTAPRYRRHLTAKWSRLAQKQLRKAA